MLNLQYLILKNIVVNEYKELGELKTKHVGGSTNTALQKVDYKYNIRGWLTDINNVDTLEDDVFDLFAFKISYDNLRGIPLYNGNISQTLWRTSADNMIRRYNYYYDNLNRLTDAAYKNVSTGVTNTYNEVLNYDKNGNITNLQRFGGFENPTGATMIDNLTYSYDPNSPNQLKKVVDLTNSTQGFKDDVTATMVTDDVNDDYAYDADGNMIEDENKRIINIRYNHLNLPTRVQFANNKEIQYTYDATGVKLRKEVHFGGDNKVMTDYLNGYQYETKSIVYNGRGYAQLLFFPHAEGYVKAVYSLDVSNKQPLYKYVYNYTDHLGNVRLSYINEGEPKVIEENHYYAFGLKHANYNDTKQELVLEPNLDGFPDKIKAVPSTEGTSNYKYNNKELQEELGLNWYDYGARNYQADLGRWMNIDPLASNTPSWTPYNYVENTPVNAIDPDGLSCVGCGSNGEDMTPPETDRNPQYIGGPGDPPDYPLTGGVQQLDEVVVNSKNPNYNPSVALENNTGYTYTSDDLNLRKQLKQSRIFNVSIKNLEKAGQFLPLGAERYMNFVGVDNYNMYRFAAGVTLAFEITAPPGAGSGPTFSRTFNYTPRVSPRISIHIHGNSLQSPKPTWFYKLYKSDGTFLKNGITNKATPESRYTKAFMRNKYMGNKRLFPNRRGAYNFEFQQNVIQRGPLNLNMH